jgi:hypothetical protein
VSKVIGAKVTDGMYEKIASIGTISVIVKQAVNEYLERHGCNGDSVVNYTVNRNVFENKYQALTRLIDKHLNALNKAESPICCICNDPVESEPYRIFGDLYYCSRKCWLNGDTK